jgi:hypothetical protein
MQPRAGTSWAWRVIQGASWLAVAGLLAAGCIGTTVSLGTGVSQQGQEGEGGTSAGEGGHRVVDGGAGGSDSRHGEDTGPHPDDDSGIECGIDGNDCGAIDATGGDESLGGADGSEEADAAADDSGEVG